LDTLREAVPTWVGGDRSQENSSDGENVVTPRTLPVRCVDALTALIKLWDVRTEECKARETQKAANKSNPQAGDIPMKDSNASATGPNARSGTVPNQPDDERDELESDNEDIPSHDNNASGDITVAHNEPQSNINDGGKPPQPPASSASSTAVPNHTSPNTTTALEPWDTTSFSGFDFSVFENAPSFLDTQMLLDPNFAFVLDPQYMEQNTSSLGY